MNQTQSIIVYRNPLEQAFWEGTMSGGFPLLCAIIIACCVTVAVCSVWDNIFQRMTALNKPANVRNFARRMTHNTDKVAIVTAIATVFVVLWVML